MNGNGSPIEQPEHRAETDYPPQARAETVRGAGAWLPWAGLLLAIVWWGCVAAALVTILDITAVGRQPPVTLAAGALLALLPGLLLLMAGFMARESARAAAANTRVLEASEHLLDPAGRAGARAESLAAQMSASASQVDRAMNHALSAMKAMSEEIGDERMRLESVSYAAADNARDLRDRLAEERAGLETIARQLRAQTDELAEAIPRQNQAIMESARQAAEGVAQADAALEARLQHMRESSGQLSAELERLEQLAAGAERQSEALTFAISRVEEKLEKSQATVDAALRSGEMAAAAAGTTGDAIQTAADNAIAGARQAQQDIQSSTRSASEEAARALAALQQRAEDVSAAIKAAGMAARAETDMTERRLSQAGNAFREAVDSTAGSGPATRPSPPPEAPADAGRDAGARPEPTLVHAREPSRRDVESPPRQIDDDLFETSPSPEPPPSVPPPPQNWNAESRTSARGGQAGPRPENSSAITVDYTDHPRDRGDIFEPAAEPVDPMEDTAPAGRTPAPGDTPPPPPSGDAAWTSILSDIDRSDSGQLPREDTAEHVIQRLENSGIALASIFRPREKKKIALAARKGEVPRRSAILNSARGEVERVSKRLRADDELAQLAHDFLSMEAPDAIAALDRTQKSSRNASPRLSAFLLLDAAVGEMRPAA